MALTMVAHMAWLPTWRLDDVLYKPSRRLPSRVPAGGGWRWTRTKARAPKPQAETCVGPRRPAGGYTGGEPAIGPVRNGLENGLRTVGPGSLRTRRGARRERGGATGG